MESVYCAVQTQTLTVIPAEVRLCTFSGRTRGSCLETFRAANVSDSTLRPVFPLIISECVCKNYVLVGLPCIVLLLIAGLQVQRKFCNLYCNIYYPFICQPSCTKPWCTLTYMFLLQRISLFINDIFRELQSNTKIQMFMCTCWLSVKDDSINRVFFFLVIYRFFPTQTLYYCHRFSFCILEPWKWDR